MKIFTIGFTKKSAEGFFDLLEKHGVQKIIDIRISSSSQLAGFAKDKDLAYFARKILGIPYEHRLELAPTKELMNGYRSGEISGEGYKQRYLELLEQRNVLQGLEIADFENACLLCSEHEPEGCHRKVLAERLSEEFEGVEVVHLL